MGGQSAMLLRKLRSLHNMWSSVCSAQSFWLMDCRKGCRLRGWRGVRVVARDILSKPSRRAPRPLLPVKFPSPRHITHASVALPFWPVDITPLSAMVFRRWLPLSQRNTACDTRISTSTIPHEKIRSANSRREHGRPGRHRTGNHHQSLDAGSGNHGALLRCW